MRARLASIEWQAKLPQFDAQSARSSYAAQYAQLMGLIANYDNASMRSVLNEIHLFSAKTRS